MNHRVRGKAAKEEEAKARSEDEGHGGHLTKNDVDKYDKPIGKAKPRIQI